jgi:hypothetical protein
VTASSAHDRLHLPFTNLEIDKDGNYWMVRYFPNDQLVLQLRIRQYTNEFSAEFICEIRLRGTAGFSTLAEFTYDPIALADWRDPEFAPCVCCFPETWREVFVGMAQHWANLNSEVQFAPSGPVIWKEGERDPTFVDSSDHASNSDETNYLMTPEQCH